MSFFSPTMNIASSSIIEGAAFIGRLYTRKGMYGRALVRSRDVSKPLVVVGAPTAGLVRGKLAQYKCGDMPCVDVRGCNACGARPRDLTKSGAIPVRDGGAVVLVQHVLEHIEIGPEGDPDVYIRAAWDEITRAAGNSADVFVSRLQEWATFTRAFGGANWIIDSAPPNKDGQLKYHRVRKPPKTISKAQRSSGP